MTAARSSRTAVSPATPSTGPRKAGLDSAALVTAPNVDAATDHRRRLTLAVVTVNIYQHPQGMSPPWHADAASWAAAARAPRQGLLAHRGPGTLAL